MSAGPGLKLDVKDFSELFPQGEDLQRQVGSRRRKEGWAKYLFVFVLMLAIGALATLLYTIINSAFGITAVVNQVEPDELVAAAGYDPAITALEELTYDDLVGLLQVNVSNGAGRRLERERRFYEDRLVWESPEIFAELCSSSEPPTGCDSAPRGHSDLLQMVNERIVEPTVLDAWTLFDSVTRREAIELEILSAEYQEDNPGARPEFRAWLSWQFITSPQNPDPELAGVRTAILGTLWVIAITIVFAFPVGVAAAIYLEEYAKPNRLNRMIQTNINNLAGVPSIIYGMLGLAIFVRALEPLTSGAVLAGDAPHLVENGRTVLSAGITLGLLILPIVIIASQEAIRAVPNSLRAAGLALGATRWQTIRKHILPVALPGILTGSILATARAMGETAPLVVVGASTFIVQDPTGPFSKFTVLPIQIFQWTTRPQVGFQEIAAAAILVLLALLLTMNATAVILRNRYSRSFK
ncbi:MAG: phosphate ABC transporter permease PstA [Acidimicrobiia bacterium]|nr:phosphate ABC transporter permease PstA [Acidimicrobiia bacterium]